MFSQNRRYFFRTSFYFCLVFLDIIHIKLNLNRRFVHFVEVIIFQFSVKSTRCDVVGPTTAETEQGISNAGVGMANILRWLPENDNNYHENRTAI